MPTELIQEVQSVIGEINNRNRKHSQSRNFVPLLRDVIDDDGLSLAEDEQSTSTDEDMFEDLRESNDDSSVHTIDGVSLSTDMSVENDQDIDSHAETQSIVFDDLRQQRQLRSVSICEDV